MKVKIILITLFILMICSCTFNSSIQKTNIIETLSCDATFCFTEEIVSIKTKIYTSKIKDMQAGKIIKISLDSKRNAPTERETLGYFYINEKNIYLLIAYDDETALSLSEEEIFENSYVAYATESTEDILAEDEKGWHSYVEVKNDNIIYHGYDNTIETGYYMTITWDKSMNLKAFRNGFGAGRESIELKVIIDL